MKILALELSSPRGSIAWLTSDAVDPFVVAFPNDRKHSGDFFRTLEACLKRFGHPDRVVVGLGPGSYAGTKIALATATGLAAATGAQLRGLPSLLAIETAAEEYVVIGDARRQSFHFTEVRQRRCVVGPLLQDQAELAERLREIELPVFTNEALPLFPAAEVRSPSARILAELGREATAEAAQPLEPIYLRAPHITSPKSA